MPKTKGKRKVKAAWTQAEGDVEGGGSGVLVAPGYYVLNVDSAELRDSKKSDYDLILIRCKITEGAEGVGGTVFENLSLNPRAMWKLFQLLVAMGKNVNSKKDQTINLDNLEGAEFGAFLEHDEYEGKTKSKVGEMLSAEEARTRIEGTDGDEEEEEEEEEAPKKKKKPKAKAKAKAKKSKAKKEEEDEEEEEDEGEEEEEEEDEEEVDIDEDDIEEDEEL